jgi:hypothetical protein
MKLTLFLGAWSLIFPIMLSQGVSVARAEEPGAKVLGQESLILISIVRADGQPICPSFSFAQIPGRPEWFLGKNPIGDGKNPCGGAQALNLFRLDWNTHVMTLVHPVLQTPITYGSGTITAAYDPWVEKHTGELWVSFECAGLHIAGTSACVAPLSSELQNVDVSRLSIPISGEDADPHSGFSYSASTPKLLDYEGRLYLFWSAIRVDNTTHQWLSTVERGVELFLQPDGKLMAKGANGHWLPSNAPLRNFVVLSPQAGDRLRDASIDTEGFFKTPQGVIALSSVGGHGPDGRSCLKPRDKVPGCYSLQINRANGDPLRENAFQDERAIAPKFPANPVEYPRIVTGPDNRLYLMANIHPINAESVPLDMKKLDQTGYALIPFPLNELVFKKAHK